MTTTFCAIMGLKEIIHSFLEAAGDWIFGAAANCSPKDWRFGLL